MLRASGLDRLLFPTGLLAFSGLPLNTLTAMGLTAVFVTACCLYDLVYPYWLGRPSPGRSLEARQSGWRLQAGLRADAATCGPGRLNKHQAAAAAACKHHGRFAVFTRLTTQAYGFGFGPPQPTIPTAAPALTARP